MSGATWSTIDKDHGRTARFRRPRDEDRKRNAGDVVCVTPSIGMMKLIEATFVSLDGAIESPAKWSMPLWSDEQKAYVNNQLADRHAFLLGRVTYEECAATWPQTK